MSPDDFVAWRRAMGYSQDRAAQALGLSRSTVQNYGAGVRRGDGEPVEIPLHIALACAALYHRLEPWRP